MTVTLVLGGARSGKSRHAEALIARLPGPYVYVATGEARDTEMVDRIALHRSRRGVDWSTIEEPLELSDVVQRTEHAAQPMLIDCLTLWTSNLMFAERDIPAACATLEAALARRQGDTVLVSNEVGLGIVPDNALARRFRDEAGTVNQRIAAVADRVLFVVAGLPMTVK